MNPSFLRISAVTLALLAASPVLAQEAIDEAETVVTTTEDGGADWGWIGLLGLIGLAGLSGRRRNDVTSTTR